MIKWGILPGKISANLVVFILSAAMLLAVGGCVQPAGGPKPTPAVVYELAPTFREINQRLGDEEVMGKAISDLLMQDGIEYQYVENALYSYNRSAPSTSWYKLLPLGVDMGYQDPPVPPPTTPGLKYVNGQVILPEFVPFYEKHLGNAFFGKPISEVHYNPNRNRYEQYFENVALFRKVGAAQDKVGLLAYGSAFCGENCAPLEDTDRKIDVLRRKDTPFRAKLDQLTATVTGFPLTDPYQSADGKLEQVFENVVLAADQYDLGTVALRPLDRVLTLPKTRPEAANGDPAYHFYPIENDLGYNIRMDLWEYLQAHGGIELSGPPISAIETRTNQRQRQCFVNLCLAYDENLPEGYRIRLEPLGYLYRDMFSGNQDDQQGAAGEDRQNLILSIWEQKASLRPGEIQEIFVRVLNGNDPVVGIQPELGVTLPNGDKQRFIFSPTNASGESSVRLPLMEARNYTLVTYWVCLNGDQPDRLCKNDTFVILNSQ